MTAITNVWPPFPRGNPAVDSLPSLPRPSMDWGSEENSGGGRKVIPQAITTVLSLCIPCRHRRQSVTGRTVTSGVHEMFLVCTRCGKRLSPGVLLGPGTASLAPRPSGPAPELAPANSLAK